MRGLRLVKVRCRNANPVVRNCGRIYKVLEPGVGSRCVLCRKGRLKRV